MATTYEFTITDGIVRWKSNGRVPFDDVLKGFELRGLITHEQRERSNAAAKIESAEIIAEYRRNRERNGYSAEEISEMRGAFGPGADIVDVLTGKRIRI